jgi:hypothetical protein
MKVRGLIKLGIASLVMFLCGCTGMQTFTTAARPGETLALAVGRQQNLQRGNLTVTITPSSGTPAVYPPNDSRVRSIANLYPDPVSQAVVDTLSGQAGTNGAYTGQLINWFATGNDQDWWQTVILLDLPAGIVPGTASISFSDSLGASIHPVSVEVLSGASQSNPFNVLSPFDHTSGIPIVQNFPYVLSGIERASNYVVNFTGSVVPYSIQAQFTHTSGVGKLWVANPHNVKNVSWSDDGSILTVLITPSNGKTPSEIKNLKFYVAGGVSGLSPSSVKAYDQYGSPVDGITPVITQN